VAHHVFSNTREEKHTKNIKLNGSKPTVPSRPVRTAHMWVLMIVYSCGTQYRYYKFTTCLLKWAGAAVYMLVRQGVKF